MVAPAAGMSADLAAGRTLADEPTSGARDVTAFGPTGFRQTCWRRYLAIGGGAPEYSLRALVRAPHETMPQITFTPDQLDDIVGYIMSLQPTR